MKCLERETVFAYVHKLLEAREEGEARAHLAECARCRAALDEYRRLDSVLEEWKPVEPSPWFDARLRAAVARSGVRQSGWSVRDLVRLRWLAPAFVLVLAASTVILRLPNSRHPRKPALSQVTLPVPAVQPAAPSEEEQELSLYQNLPVLEDYDLLADFDVLSELPKSEK